MRACTALLLMYTVRTENIRVKILVFAFQPQKCLKFCVFNLLKFFACLTTEICRGRRTFFQENLGNNWKDFIAYISQNFDIWKYDVTI